MELIMVETEYSVRVPICHCKINAFLGITHMIVRWAAPLPYAGAAGPRASRWFPTDRSRRRNAKRRRVGIQQQRPGPRIGEGGPYTDSTPRQRAVDLDYGTHRDANKVWPN